MNSSVVLRGNQSLKGPRPLMELGQKPLSQKILEGGQNEAMSGTASKSTLWFHILVSQRVRAEDGLSNCSQSYSLHVHEQRTEQARQVLLPHRSISHL